MTPLSGRQQMFTGCPLLLLDVWLKPFIDTADTQMAARFGSLLLFPAIMVCGVANCRGICRGQFFRACGPDRTCVLFQRIHVNNFTLSLKVVGWGSERG